MNEVVTIVDYDHQGRGIGKINNKIVFVPHTILGEQVTIKITKEKKNYLEGQIINIKKKSPLRVENSCPYFEICGGCDLLHMPYSEQLKYKYNKINNIIRHYVHKNVPIKDIIPSDLQFHYRNRVTLHVDDKNVGFYSKKSNKIIKINTCLLLDDKLNSCITKTKYPSQKTNITFLTNGKEVLKEKNAQIIKTIGKNKFYVSLESFFQVNDNVTFKMYEKIKEYCSATKKDYILDLYCGTGTIGIYVSDICKEVLGIEINSKAIIDANKNKELNNINNIHFIGGDVAKTINCINFKPTIIIVDPPRAGLDKKTIQNIINFKPQKLIYTSCDPMTLARDLNILKNEFDIKEITPFDMFPNTHHVECVCFLVKK